MDAALVARRLDQAVLAMPDTQKALATYQALGRIDESITATLAATLSGESDAGERYEVYDYMRAASGSGYATSVSLTPEGRITSFVGSVCPRRNPSRSPQPTTGSTPQPDSKGATMKPDWKLVLPSDAVYDAADAKYWADAYGESDVRPAPNGERPLIMPDDRELDTSSYMIALVPNARPTRPFSLADGLGARWIVTHA